MKRRRVQVLLLILAALAVGIALMVRAAGHSDPVSLQDVLDRFRAGGSVGAATDPPAPGVYTYAVDGDEAGGIGALRVRRDLPRLATMTVRRTAGGWETETTFSKQHVEGARYRVVGGAVVMTWRREDVTFAGIGRDDRRDIVGRYRIAPVAPVVGARFTDRYTVGSLRNDVTTRVTGRRTVSVGDTRVRTVIIQSRTTTAGALSGTREEVMWWSPDLRVPVRAILTVDIGGVFGYDSRLEMALTGVTPAT